MKMLSVMLSALVLSSGLTYANLIKSGDEVRYLVEPKSSKIERLKNAESNALLEEKLNALIEAQMMELSRDLESRIEIKLAHLIK